MMRPDSEDDHAEHGMLLSYEIPPTTAAAHMGHDQHTGHSVAMFRDKFWLTLFLTVPVVVWSADVHETEVDVLNADSGEIVGKIPTTWGYTGLPSRRRQAADLRATAEHPA